MKFWIKCKLLCVIILNPNFSICQEVQIISCQSKQPLENVLLIKDNILLGGESTEDGQLKFPLSWKGDDVLLRKMGYRDTIIKLKNDQNYCLRQSSFSLEAVSITSNKVSIEDQLRSYVYRASQQMLSRPDTLYYRFNLQIRDTNNNYFEKRRGIVTLKLNPYDKKYDGSGGSKYCTLTIIIDSTFWNSEKLPSYVRHRTMSFIESNFLRKGHFPRKKFDKNTQFNRVYNSTLPTFEIEADKSQKDKREYHRLVFNPDSSIKSSEYRWLAKENELIDAKIGLKLDEWSYSAKYSYRLFIKSPSSIQDSVFIKESYLTEGGNSQTTTFSMKLLPLFKEDSSCKNQTLFLKLAPEEFKEKGLQDWVIFK